MKIRYLALLMVAALVVTYTLAALSTPSSWEAVAPGIDFQVFHLEDPNNVYVARMDRANPNVTIESSLAYGRINGGLQKVTDMASRYDQAINFWGQEWGARDDVVVAINGGYFTASGPLGGVIHSGWYAKRFENFGGYSGFAWMLNRDAFIGGCVNHRADKQRIYFPPSTTNYMTFNDVNVPRYQNSLILYTPQNGASTGTADGPNTLEVLVEMTQPAMVYPSPAYITGYVRAIRDGKGSTSIPFDHVVLSAHGTARTALLSRGLKLGDEIGISQEITNYNEDCTTVNDQNSWTTTYASIQGHFVFLKAGIIQSFTDPGALERHPRTAIAYDANYIYFIVVDGRAPGVSIGMTIAELATFAQSSLGATDGVAEDGGGSSVMVVNGAVQNHPSDPCYKILAPFIINSAAGVQRIPGRGSPAQPASTWCERPVANGLMMLVVEPKQQSTTYTPGDTVSTSGYANLRLGPGTNYPILTTLPPGSGGVVLQHMNNLDGVLAKGSYWWKVDFNGVTGWISQGLLGTPGKGARNLLPVE